MAESRRRAAEQLREIDVCVIFFTSCMLQVQELKCDLRQRGLPVGGEKAVLMASLEEVGRVVDLCASSVVWAGQKKQC